MGKRILPSKAEELNKNWRGKNGKGPGPAIAAAGFKDTYETWFSIDELEAYLEYVKSHIPAEDNPGIRIYFGNYGKDGGSKKNQSTVFLAPTRQVNDEIDTDTTNENDYSLDAYNDGEGPWPPAPYNSNAS